MERWRGLPLPGPIVPRRLFRLSLLCPAQTLQWKLVCFSISDKRDLRRIGEETGTYR